MLQAMIDAAPACGVDVVAGEKWTQSADVLMTYGLGHPERRIWTQKHRSRGGRLIGWDLGYWARDTPETYNMRVTVDADHPHRLITPESPERFDAYGMELREDANEKGPIVLCGLGAKQRRYLGFPGTRWEMRKLMELKARYPKREIRYRPKRDEPPIGHTKLAKGTIEQAIKGASLVVCMHSNVAVDACIAGIPVECADGAALALYRDNPKPSREQRIEFLRSLAHWQYNPTEAETAWKFLMNKLSV